MKCLQGLVLAALFVGAGCSSFSLVERRISRYPEMFQRLPGAHQALVREGRIKEGLSKDAVFLAWGNPDGVRETSRKGVAGETWIYTGQQTIRTAGIGFGLGYDPWCGSGLYGAGPVFGPEVYVQRYEIARVSFENGKVVSWERNLRR